jgi:outer membrane usher protein
MLWSRCSRLAKETLAIVQLVAWPALALAQAAPAHEALYLEVFINGQPTGLIANFVLRSEQRLAITVTELQELRIKSDRLPVSSDGLIDLDRCSGLSYQYNQVKQIVRIEISDQGRLPFVVDTKARREAKPTDIQTAAGAVVNYTLFGSTNADPRTYAAVSQMQTNFSAGFDARVFSQYGVFTQSGLLNSAITAAVQGVRLDSTWSYSDPDTLITYRAGDVISGGLSWTRSLRLGGAQVQRNFALRPDLVTLPMPQYSGSAALPSTVDIFVNNVRGYSGTVPAGPFQIQNLPVMSGSGNQSIVVQDALGRQTVINQPFYSSPKMLAGGLFDFSVETGFTRREYGVSSNAYDKSPAASGSLRYGLNDWLTLEGHAEGSDAVMNAGAGANLLLSSWGVASLAVAGSGGYGNSAGALVAASLELGRGGYTFYARTQRTTTAYLDLASLPSTTSLVPGISLLATRPPRAIDQVALNAPLTFDSSSVTLSMTRMLDALQNRYDILGVSYSRSLPYNASLFITAFKDFDDKKSYGIFGGLTLSFSGGISAASSISKTGTGLVGGVEVIKSQPLEADSWGWRIRDLEGSNPSRAAAVSYRSSVGRAEVGAQQINGKTQATAQVDGAVAFVGGNTFLANRIDDAFAVVDAGAPNVDVFYENRPVATTGASGMVLVPYLRAYQNNSISIDARNLAADTEVPSTKISVVPSDRSAALVKFGVSQDARNALVAVKDGNGRALAAGSHARVNDGKEEAMVGYGGEIYLRGLEERNILFVDRAGGGSCNAEFEYRPTPGSRVLINDVVCR